MEIIKDISKHIFRGYDIRGIYGEDLFEPTAYTIGKAYGTMLKNDFKTDKVVIGHDNRVSSPALSKMLIKGIVSTGVNVIDIGLVTSPMLYYANVFYNIPAGVMVTASHSPKEYNGFKIAFDERGEICGEEIVKFRDFVLNSDFIEGKGSIKAEDIKQEYIKMILSKFHFKNKLKVVVDAGNGTASIIAKDIFSKLNLDVSYIFCDSDPTFPNHHPDPAEAENMVALQAKVKEENADIGIAFDGDCDRVGCVDNEGKILSSDYYMAIMSRYILPNVDKSKRKVIFDVSCSKTLSDEIKKCGGIPVVYKTGNSFIKREMLKEKLVFGGEISGHTFFYDKFYGFDDGVYAALRMIEILDNDKNTLAQIESTLNKYESTPVIKITVDEYVKAEIVEKVKAYCKQKGYTTSTIDGARPEFDDGFAIVRMSNTSPKLTLRFEAQTKTRLASLKQEFESLVNKLIKETK
ncbi:MAG: phosphomannomutase/phosphoglucomutase [Clostridia bacterium]